MSQLETTSRIPLTANRGVTGALFGLAIITYGIRTYVRACILRQFSAEDVILLLGVVCLCGGISLIFHTMPYHYDLLAVLLDGRENKLSFDFIKAIPMISKEINAAHTLGWCVLFSVKLTYLLFFRRLISRVHNLNTWWWFVFIFTIAAGCTCLAVVWINCPYFTIKRMLSCSGPTTNYKTLRSNGITTAMDITTDALVVSIPIVLLWRVRINIRQKIGLGILLCLSIVMAIIAMTRISAINLAPGALDIIWLAFWQQQECSVAVIMVSISAFRSLFLVSTSKKPSPKDFSRPRYRNRLYQKFAGSEKDTGFGLPQIPGATLTGMRSVIRHGGQYENLVPRPGRFEEVDTVSKQLETTLPDSGNVMEGRDMV